MVIYVDIVVHYKEICDIIVSMKKLKRISKVDESLYGVCVWRMPDGAFLGDGDGNVLSIEGKMYDIVLESKMRKAAIYYLGDEAREGSAHWISGARKISENEHDDQMERLMDGHIPDIVDATRQKTQKGLILP